MMQLSVDDLTFEVRESSRRKTLEITVDPVSYTHLTLPTILLE